MMCRQGDLAVATQEIHTQPWVENYLLEPPEDSSVWAILAVRPVVVPGTLNVETVRRYRDPPEGAFASGVSFWFEPPATVWLRRAPCGPLTGVYEVDFSTVPNPDACAIDPALAVDNYETLINGARWLIHEVSGKPWSSPELAGLYRMKFLSGVQAAKGFELTGRQRGLLKMAVRRIV